MRPVKKIRGIRAERAKTAKWQIISASVQYFRTLLQISKFVLNLSLNRRTLVKEKGAVFILKTYMNLKIRNMNQHFYLGIFIFLLLLGCGKEEEIDKPGEVADEFIVADVNGNSQAFKAAASTVLAQFSSNRSSLLIQGQDGSTKISFTIGNNMFKGVGNYDGTTMGYTVNLTSYANNATFNGQTGYSILNVTSYNEEYVEGNFEFKGLHHSSSNVFLITNGSFRAKLNN